MGERGSSSYNNFEASTSNFSEHLDVTNSNNNSYYISLGDNFVGEYPTCSLQPDIEEESLNDIFQVLLKVPLQAMETCNHHLKAPTQKDEEIFVEDQLARQAQYNMNIVAQGSQICEGPEGNEGGITTGNLLGKQPLEHEAITHTPPYDESHDHLPTRRRNREQKRRERINSKLRAIQALIPNSDKRDHASILDNAINHIKSLQLHVEMLGAARSSIGPSSEYQASYTPLCPPIIIQATGCTPPWPQLPMVGPPSYPLMIPPPNFPVPIQPRIIPPTNPRPPKRRLNLSSPSRDPGTGPSEDKARGLR